MWYETGGSREGDDTDPCRLFLGETSVKAEFCLDGDMVRNEDAATW